MKLYLESAEIFIPDGQKLENALARTTHMGIGAHQDDLEIMALSGILECFQRDDQWFCGVVVTNGSGSPREELYKNYTDDEMCVVDFKAQNMANHQLYISILAGLYHRVSIFEGCGERFFNEDMGPMLGGCASRSRGPAASSSGCPKRT